MENLFVDVWPVVGCWGTAAREHGTGVREHGIRDRGTIIYVCYVGTKYIIVINNLRPPGLVHAECSYYSVLYYYCIIL